MPPPSTEAGWPLQAVGRSKDAVEEVEVQLGGTDAVHIRDKLFSPPEQCHKALRIHWDTRADTLHVATPTLTPDDRPSKRMIESDVEKTFDLLGWFSPSIVLVKILLQKPWSEKLAWDEPVPEQLAEEWRERRDQLHLITRHAVPRYHLDRGKRVRSLQLHDASDVAYAGVAYLRAVYEDATVSIKLLYSKTQVAPLTGSLLHIWSCAVHSF